MIGGISPWLGAKSTVEYNSFFIRMTRRLITILIEMLPLDIYIIALAILNLCISVFPLFLDLAYLSFLQFSPFHFKFVQQSAEQGTGTLID